MKNQLKNAFTHPFFDVNQLHKPPYYHTITKARHLRQKLRYDTVNHQEKAKIDDKYNVNNCGLASYPMISNFFLVHVEAFCSTFCSHIVCMKSLYTKP